MKVHPLAQCSRQVPRLASRTSYQTVRIQVSKSVRVRPVRPAAAASQAAEILDSAVDTIGDVVVQAKKTATTTASVVTSPVFWMCVACLVKSLTAILTAFITLRLLRRWVLQEKESRETVLDEVRDADSPEQAPSLWRFVLVSAVYKPTVAFVPWLVLSYIWRETLATLHGAYAYWQSHKREFPSWFQDWMKDAIKSTAQYDVWFDMVYTVAAVVFAAWLLIGVKDALVDLWIGSEKRRKSTTASEALQRMVLPLSSLGTWVMTAAAVLYAMQIAGIDLKPLLAIGGVSGVVVGLSAQSVLANLIAGVNLFISRPFIPGERISLYSAGGSHVLSGTVERIDPLRTMLTDSDNLPYVVPNKLMQDMQVSNESRMTQQALVPSIGSRKLKVSVTCAVADETVGQIIEALERDLAGLGGSNGANPGRANGCVVDVLGCKDDTYSLTVTMTVAAAAARTRKNFVQLRQRVVQRILQTIRTFECRSVSASIMP